MSAFKDTFQTIINTLGSNVFIEKAFKTVLLFISFLLIVSCEPFSPENKPYFWKAKKDGKTSYFLGTYHEGVSLDESLCSDIIVTKLKNSDLVLTELGSFEDTAENQEWDALYFSPNGEDFKQLNPESQKFLEQNGIRKDLSYWALYFVLRTLCVKEAVGEELAQISMDYQVEQTAKHLNIPVETLDTPELRKPLTNFHKKEDIERQIENLHLCSQVMQITIAHYKKGKPNPYATKGLAMWIENRYTTDEYDKWSLKNRNKKWLTQFKSVHKNYTHIFVAAGNAHFVSPFNMIDMLREDGFDTERVSCQ